MEIKVREFDSRMLIAANLATIGHAVFIGEKNRINKLAKGSQNSIYLAKSASNVDLPLFSILHQNRHRIAVLDEEAMIHQNEKAHVNSRMNAQCMALIDYMFCWGPYDREVARSGFTEVADKIVETGNPRIDLLLPRGRTFYQDVALQHQQTYGDYIFVPSSFAMCNHFSEPGPRLKWRASLGMIKSPDDEVFYTEYANHFQAIFEKMLAAVADLAKKWPDRNIVVRPHPSENEQPWHELADRFPNIHLEKRGSVASWLLGAKLVIHNGCTTAVEGFLLDRPIITYRPATSDTYDLKIPNNVGEQVFTFADLVSAVENQYQGRLDTMTEDRKDYLRQFLRFDESPTAFGLISDYLSLLSVNQSFTWRPQIEALPAVIKKAMKWAMGRSGRNSYSSQKFPHLSREEATVVLEKCALFDQRFEKLQCLTFGKDCFLLFNDTMDISPLSRSLWRFV